MLKTCGHKAKSDLRVNDPKISLEKRKGCSHLSFVRDVIFDTNKILENVSALKIKPKTGEQI